MILGLGNDLVDIRRIERTLGRFGRRFVARVFTEAKLTTPRSRQNTPCRSPVPSALAQASLAAKRLA